MIIFIDEADAFFRKRQENYGSSQSESNTSKSNKSESQQNTNKTANKIENNNNSNSGNNQRYVGSNGNISENLRNAINAFLYRTGTPSK